MEDQEILFFDASQANNVACDYLCTPGKANHYAIVSQVFDLVNASHLEKDTPYTFTTKLFKWQFLDVLSKLGLEPKECHVNMVGVLTRTFTVKF